MIQPSIRSLSISSEPFDTQFRTHSKQATKFKKKRLTLYQPMTVMNSNKTIGALMLQAIATLIQAVSYGW